MALVQEELDAVFQLVVELHLGDDDVDGDLQRRDVDLAQHRLHLGVGLTVRVGDDRVVRDVSGQSQLEPGAVILAAARLDRIGKVAF